MFDWWLRTPAGSKKGNDPDAWRKGKAAEKIAPKTKFSFRSQKRNDETKPNIYNGDFHGIPSQPWMEVVRLT
jgi:hypothetical protein